MALHKIIQNLSIGLGSFGFASGASYYFNNIKEDDLPSTPIASKNIQSLFFKNIKPNIILDILKSNKMLTGLITSSTIASFVLIRNFGLGNIMYSTRNQLQNGIILLTNNINCFKNNFETFRQKILGNVNNLDTKVSQNHQNIKLIIKSKSDELKCEIKDVKNNQIKAKGLLDLMSDKINIIENQGRFITKGVYLLCNSAINNESFKQQDVDQIKQYKQFEQNFDLEKIT
tara:strand:+ start:79 stop:768 length:690 start_codon:yes stop_codon:yes gene_type:complete